MKIFNSFTLIILLFFFFIINNLNAQRVKVENVRFELEGGKVVIYFDLKGEHGEKYDISIFLLNDDDPGYRHEPEFVSGDIGEVEYFGIDKKIIWDIDKEFPEGLEGEGFYFEVIAEEAGGGIAWYYFVGAAVLGGSAAVLLSGGTESANGTTNGASTNDIADPPARPGGL